MHHLNTSPPLPASISASKMVKDCPNMNTLPTRFVLTALALSCAALAMPAAAQTMHVETSGRGQALIFPYYTVRNGTVSYVSLVNQTVAAKALRVRVRESVGGRPVAELNVFLSAKDMWTAAIVPTTDGASIVSNDKSCTLPKFRGNTSSIPIPVTFSNAAYLTDTLSALDRTREGYLEVIEMASVPNSTPLGKDITHVAGVPSCKLVADAGSAPIQITLDAPSGGVVGSMSFINLSDGVSVSYNAIEALYLPS